ncbi:MAG: GatB/YqeY domain-containing protein [Proteobacteria bacterium]|nr:GatB/YqeY domain-containing protein [Pseudomonadota bacterium]
MSLKKSIEDAMKSALKAKDDLKLQTLRFLLAQIKNKEIDLRRELKDDEIFKVIQTLVKQRKEGIEIFEKAGRTELLEKERKELEILESYLPKMLTDQEIEKITEDIIKELGATGQKDFGRVMKAVMSKVAGMADGGKVNEIVKKKLG